MPTRKLRESLDALRGEIEDLAGRGDPSRERLETLVADIERHIDDPDDDAGRENLLENMREAIEQFEVEHPSATGVLNHIMVTLGNMGI